MSLVQRGLELLDEWLGDFDDGECNHVICVYCPCRPHMSFCGRLFTPGVESQEDNACGCPDCEDCVAAGRCQSCGCGFGEECKACE